MSQIHGVSKIWGEITAKLEFHHLIASRPQDVEPLLENCLMKYGQQLTVIQQKIENEISLSEQEISREKELADSNLLTLEEDYSLKIEQVEATLDFYRHNHGIFNFLRNYLRIRRESRKLADLHAALDNRRKTIKLPLQIKEKELEEKREQKDGRVRQECSELIAQIEFLKSLSGSQELASASAECELLEYVSELPENFHVFNNFNLNIDKGVLIDGKWQNHAQIDQLIITPSGLFAIEVKNWSKPLSGRIYQTDPYEQIKHAAHLCYALIKSDFPGVTVRSILAFRGHPPENQVSSIVKTLPLPEVSTYINWFTDAALTDQALHLLITRINEMNSAPGKGNNEIRH